MPCLAASPLANQWVCNICTSLTIFPFVHAAAAALAVGAGDEERAEPVEDLAEDGNNGVAGGVHEVSAGGGAHAAVEGAAGQRPLPIWLPNKQRKDAKELPNGGGWPP